MKTLAVIMTVHNRRSTTLSALAALYGQSLPSDVEMSVYMTDDGSTDGTRDAVAAAYRAVKIVDGDGSLFWNRGMHKAWSAAVADHDGGCDYYLWLNDDTMLGDNALEHLLAVSKLKADKALIVGSTCSAKTKTVTYGGRSSTGALVQPVEEPVECTTLNGNIVLVPRSVYDVIGMNDPYYRHALGDFDYGLRAGEKGIAVVVAPGFFGECELHDTIDKWKNHQVPLRERWRHFLSPTGANPIEFFHYRRRHFGLLAAVVTFFSNLLHVGVPRLWTFRR